LFIILTASPGWGAAPTWAEDPQTSAKVDPMVGVWALTSGVKAGEKMPADAGKNAQLLLLKGKFVAKIGDQKNEGTYTVDKSKTPQTITFVCTKGANEGQTMLAIFELDKGTLKICYDLSGKAFPEKFESKPDTKLFLATYNRQQFRRMPPRTMAPAFEAK
jgi:uncharacterized protein (TIGR03067 family)